MPPNLLIFPKKDLQTLDFFRTERQAMNRQVKDRYASMYVCLNLIHIYNHDPH